MYNIRIAKSNYMVIVLFCVNIDNTSSKLFTYLKNNEQRKDTVLANQSIFELFISFASYT